MSGSHSSARRGLTYPATDSAASAAPTEFESLASTFESFRFDSRLNINSNIDLFSAPATPKSSKSVGSPRSGGSTRALSAVVRTDRKSGERETMTKLTGDLFIPDLKVIHSELSEELRIINKEVRATVEYTVAEEQKSRSFARKTIDSMRRMVCKAPPQPEPTLASIIENRVKRGLEAAAKAAGYGWVLKVLGDTITSVILFFCLIVCVSFGGVVLAHLIRWHTGNVAVASGVLMGFGGFIFANVHKKDIRRIIAWGLAGIIIYHSDALEGTPHRELYDSIRENLGHHNVTMFHIAKGLADNRRCYASNFTLPSCGDVKNNTGHLVSIFGEVFKGVLVHSDMMSGAAPVNLSYQGRVISTKIHVLRGITLGDQVHKGYSFMSSLFGETPEDVTPPEIANLTDVDKQFLYLAYAELHAVRTATERKRAMEMAEGHKRLVNSARVFAGFMTLVVRDPSLWSTVNFGSDFYQGAYTFYSNLFPSEHELVLQEGLDMCKVAACLGGTPDVAPPPPKPIVSVVIRNDTLPVISCEPKIVEVPKEVVVYKEVVKTVEVPKEVVEYKEVVKEVPAPDDTTWASYMTAAVSGVCFYGFTLLVAAVAFDSFLPQDALLDAEE